MDSESGELLDTKWVVESLVFGQFATLDHVKARVDGEVIQSEFAEQGLRFREAESPALPRHRGAPACAYQDHKLKCAANVQDTSQFKGLPLLALAALLSAACGAPTGSGDPGLPDYALPGSTVLSALSADQLTDVCEATKDYQYSNIGAETYCRQRGQGSISPSTPEEEYPTVCDAAYDSCMKDSAKVIDDTRTSAIAGCPDFVLQVPGSGKEISTCSGTLAELQSCERDSLRSYDNFLPVCADLTRDNYLDYPEPPESCVKLAATCN